MFNSIQPFQCMRTAVATFTSAKYTLGINLDADTGAVPKDSMKKGSEFSKAYWLHMTPTIMAWSQKLNPYRLPVIKLLVIIFTSICSFSNIHAQTFEFLPIGTNVPVPSMMGSGVTYTASLTPSTPPPTILGNYTTDDGLVNFSGTTYVATGGVWVYTITFSQPVDAGNLGTIIWDMDFIANYATLSVSGGTATTSDFSFHLWRFEPASYNPASGVVSSGGGDVNGGVLTGSAGKTLTTLTWTINTQGETVGVGVALNGMAVNPPENCTNGIDDDGDGLVDCADPDCAVSEAGSGKFEFTLPTIPSAIGHNFRKILKLKNGNFATIGHASSITASPSQQLIRISDPNFNTINTVVIDYGTGTVSNSAEMIEMEDGSLVINGYDFTTPAKLPLIKLKPDYTLDWKKEFPSGGFQTSIVKSSDNNIIALYANASVNQFSVLKIDLAGNIVNNTRFNLPASALYGIPIRITRAANNDILVLLDIAETTGNKTPALYRLNSNGTAILWGKSLNISTVVTEEGVDIIEGSNGNLYIVTVLNDGSFRNALWKLDGAGNYLDVKSIAFVNDVIASIGSVDLNISGNGVVGATYNGKLTEVVCEPSVSVPWSFNYSQNYIEVLTSGNNYLATGGTAYNIPVVHSFGADGSLGNCPNTTFTPALAALPSSFANISATPGTPTVASLTNTFLYTVTSPTVTFTKTTPGCGVPANIELCANTLDDDSDGLIDSADPDCTCYPYENCTNGIDDDSDGLVDCNDPDCLVSGTPAEATGFSINATNQPSHVSGVTYTTTRSNVGYNEIAQWGGAGGVTPVGGLYHWSGLLSYADWGSDAVGGASAGTGYTEITFSAPVDISKIALMVGGIQRNDLTATVTLSGGTATITDFNLVQMSTGGSTTPMVLTGNVLSAPGAGPGIGANAFLFGNSNKTVQTIRITFNTPNGSDDLSASFGYLVYPCVEICTNGIDDDGDGLVDCADPDCQTVSLTWLNWSVSGINFTGTAGALGTVTVTGDPLGGAANIYPQPSTWTDQFTPSNSGNAPVYWGTSGGPTSFNHTINVSGLTNVAEMVLQVGSVATANSMVIRAYDASNMLLNHSGVQVLLKDWDPAATYSEPAATISSGQILITTIPTTGDGGAIYLTGFPSNTHHIVLTYNANLNSTGDGFFFHVGAGASAPCLAENCTNGIDDDGDGLVDCADPDCTPCASLRGDCDGNGVVNSADLTAISTEIFDGDGNDVANVAGGTYVGTCGCDANGNGTIDAGDLSCASFVISNPGVYPPCMVDPCYGCLIADAGVTITCTPPNYTIFCNPTGSSLAGKFYNITGDITASNVPFGSAQQVGTVQSINGSSVFFTIESTDGKCSIRVVVGND